MRERRSGTLIAVGSLAAWEQYPGCTLYPASKAALRALCLGLHDEVSGLGIKTCLVEPGAFKTDLLAPSSNIKQTDGQSRIADYGHINKAMADSFAQADGNQPGDPIKGADIMFDVFTSSGVAEGRPLPRYLPLGSDAVDGISKAAQQAGDETREWADIVSKSDRTEI